MSPRSKDNMRHQFSSRFTKSLFRKNLARVVAALFIGAALFVTKGTDVVAHNAPPASWVCFPSCSTGDARFLAITATSFTSSLGGADMLVGVNSAPAALGTSSVTISVFDGDSAGHWDSATGSGAPPITFTLYADPL